MSLVPLGPRLKPILLQSALLVVFFFPFWLVYQYEVSPGLRPEARVIWDVAGPIAGFVLCVVLTFVVRAWVMARKRAIEDGRR
jgi:hypothetical protein